MKSAITLGVTLGVGIWGLSGFAETVEAATRTILAGQICRAHNASEVADIDYLVEGVQNLAAQPRYVICPVVRQTTNSLGANPVYVEVWRDASATSKIQCELFSHEWDGTWLGSSTGEFNGTGSGWITLQVTASSEWSHYSVLCRLPGNAKAQIYNISVDEL